MASLSRSLTDWVSIALSSAFGWSSQAAPAITTLSRSDRSLPAANACRKAASEKATARPICWAKVAARMALSELPGHGSGQRIGMSPYARRAPLDLGDALRRARRSWPRSRRPHCCQMPPRRIGCQTGVTGRTSWMRSAAR